ncbi:MAG: hypothetical protein ACI83I_000998 [Bacteroidia bacterium]|jgi:hypothetical protein
MKNTGSKFSIRNILILAALVSLSILGISCGKLGKKTAEHRPKIGDPSVLVCQKIKQPLSVTAPSDRVFTFQISNSNSHTLTTSTGSKISIPQKAFVTKSGEVIKGVVDLTFQEYHDATDVILSGIPMTITTESGDQEAFESAGMFTVTASYKGEELDLASGKELEVNLASFKDGEQFNSYVFDEDKGNWIEIERTKPQPNVLRAESFAFLPPLPTQPTAVKKAVSSDRVFELRVDQKLNPEFRHFENVLWSLADGQEENKALFVQAIRNPRFTCINRKENIYRVSGEVREGKIFNDIAVLVKPALVGKAWENANNTFKKMQEEYAAAMKRREKQELVATKMAGLQRSIRLAKLGTYNFDCIYHLKNKVQCDPEFLIEDQDLFTEQAWLIQGSKRIAIPYTSGGYYQFCFDPDTENTLITFDAEGRLYEFDEADFGKLTYSIMRSNKKHQFKFHPTDIVVTDPAQLTDYLASL